MAEQTTLQQAAEDYYRRGWHLTPVIGKDPLLDEWPTTLLSFEDLKEQFLSNGSGYGIGGLLGDPSRDLVDVDLDVPEAVAAARYFLEEDTLTVGRQSNPRSHLLYTCRGLSTKKFKHPNIGMIAELRSTGCQTVLPPSVHPSGEPYVWANDLETPFPMEADKLREAVTKLATAALTARFLPESSRHDFALALAGFLLWPGRLDEETTLEVMRVAWEVAGFHDAKHRLESLRDLEGIVESTAEKIEAGEDIQGTGTLEDLTDESFTKTLKKWWGLGKRSRKEASEDERLNQADRLVRYARNAVTEFFKDENGEPHALVGREPVPLNSRSYPMLRRLMFEEEERSCNGEALKTAAGTMAAFAEFSGNTRNLYVRSAFLDDTLYFELGQNRVVKVGTTGWKLIDDPPVLFRRYSNLKELPNPEPGGDLTDLLAFANLKTDRDCRLFLAYVVTVVLPHIARPILNTTGPMGSGKTTLGRLVKKLIDPTAPEFVRVAYRDFLQKAAHTYVLALDNQSVLSADTTDTICRLVTGEADSKRRLYSDDDDIIYQLKRAVILNAINPPSDRADLLDRSLMLELERIEDTARRDEEAMWRAFEEQHGKLLGSIFDTLSKTLALHPDLKLTRKPRLADFGGYAAAVYKALGYSSEIFLQDWDSVVKVQHQATIDGSPVALAILEFMRDKEEHTDTSSGLHKDLEDVAANLNINTKRDKEWPKSARYLWRRIREVSSVLNDEGVETYRSRTNTNKTITLRKKRKSNGTDGTPGEKLIDKPNTSAINTISNGTSNGTEASNGTSNGTPSKPESAISEASAISANLMAPLTTPAIPYTYAESGDSAISAVRFTLISDGGLSDVVRTLEEAPVIGLDIETTGLDPHTDDIRLVQVADGNHTFVVDAFRVDPRPLFEAIASKTLLAHNAKFELSWIKEKFDIEPEDVRDTMLMSQVLYAGDCSIEHGIGPTAQRELGIELDKTLQKSAWSAETLTQAQLDYAATDAVVLLPLYGELDKKIKDAGLENIVRLEHRVLPAIVRMGLSGVAVDQEGWNALVPKTQHEIKEVEHSLLEVVPPRLGKVRRWNPKSPTDAEQLLKAGGIDVPDTSAKTFKKHLDNPVARAIVEYRKAKSAKDETKLEECERVLLELVGPPPTKTTSWNFGSHAQVKEIAHLLGYDLPDTTELTLLHYHEEHPFFGLLLRYRKLSKKVSTYGENWFKDSYREGRVRPNWRQNTTTTGRMACSNPNLQNLPRGSEHRSMFVAPAGRKLVIADYSQVELRIAAKIAGDEGMLEAFRSGEDIHTETAKILAGVEEPTKEQRSKAKAINFGLLYGMRPSSLPNYALQHYDLALTEEEAQEFYDRYFAARKGLKIWHKRMGSAFFTRGRCISVSTLLGRRRKDIENLNEVLNHPVQGTGADGLKLALALLHEQRDKYPSAVPVIVCHDEIVMECDESKAEKVMSWLVETMEAAMDEAVNRDDTPVPIEVEARIADRWSKG